MSNKKTSKRALRSAPPSAASSPMDVALLQQIIKLMASNDLNTVDVRDGDRRIILKRGAPQLITSAAVPHPAAAPFPHLPPAAAAAPLPAPVEEEAGLKAIRSPMVGTFYAKPSPEAKPFVSVGSLVDEETDVCVIEAMKVFNAIKAECRGTITKVLVQDGQPVEFGTVLFLVKPA